MFKKQKVHALKRNSYHTRFRHLNRESLLKCFLFPIRKIFILFGISFFIFECDVFAEKVPDLEWIENFGGTKNDYFNKVIKTSDNGLLTVGYSNSTDIEDFGNLGSNDAILVKYDSYGNKSWAISFGGSSYDYFYSVVEASDGGYVAVGESQSLDIEGVSNNGSSDAIIVKFNSSGKQVWVNNFGGLKSDWFSSVIEVTDGGFVVAGATNSTSISGIESKSNYYSIIIKYNSEGKQVWATSFGGSGYEEFFSVVELDDQNLIVAGYTDSTDISSLSNTTKDAILVKYSSTGKQVWAKNFGGSEWDYFTSVIVASDGNLVVCGYGDSPDIDGITNMGQLDGLIGKYDTNGNQIWLKGFGNSGYEYFRDIIEASDGGFIIAGSSTSTVLEGVANKGKADAIIVKFDSEGNYLWMNTCSGTDYEYFYSVAQLSDKGIVAVGYTKSTDIEGLDELSTTSYFDAIIVKYSVELTIEPISASNIVNVYLVPNNALQFSVNMNSIVFDEFSYTESVEKLEVLEMTVSSTLPYRINSSIVADIVGTTYGEKVDKSVLSIKTSSENDYKSFSETSPSLVLLDNQSAGSDISHKVDMKLSANKIGKVDVYKLTLKFEAEQI
jgi:hypothetical protein